MAEAHKGLIWMSRMRELLTVAFMVTLSAITLGSTPTEASWIVHAASSSARVVSPFGYGQVVQRLVAGNTASGFQMCRSISPAFTCIEVSGGASCTAAPIGSLVSCGATGRSAVDETNFQPVNCNGFANGDGGVSGLLGSNDWCLAADYMPRRQADTLYQFDDYVRLGVNTRFGGLVSELYGVDKIDRVLQNGGGGVQLSLWAFSAGYASSKYPEAYFSVEAVQNPDWRAHYDPTPFASEAACEAAHPGLQCQYGVQGPNYLSTPATYPCADNGSGAGAPYNPIQAASPTCNWGLAPGIVDSVMSLAPGQLTLSKAGPANFTRSDSVRSLTWRQTSSVVGPAAILTYAMSNPGTAQDMDFQEVPAIFLHAGLGEKVFFYKGVQPYNDVSGAVSEVEASASATGVLELPNRAGPFGTGSTMNITEDWVSACDAAAVKCLTIATFSRSAQDLIVSFDPQGSYFGVHGYFSLTNQLNRTVTVFLFPYRFDDVVAGMSIRAWIYTFQKNSAYRR